MPINHLRDFIELLDNHGQLVRINQSVSPHLEITEITDRVSKASPEHNKALLFDNLPGFDMPVLINAFGNRQRMALALGVDDLEDLNRRLREVIDPRLPGGLRGVMGRGQNLLAVLKRSEE